MAAPRLPQQFGPYTLQELIARGGMAEIYRATMPGIGGFEKTVAIKKILPHLAENDEFITMLVDEAQIIVSINHANIAQVYDLGKIDEDYYIAMEYIHGIDLSTIVKELKDTNRTVPVDHALFIASGIAAGLHVAHNKCDDTGRPMDVVHRDVSPHNILISFAGDVKIIDFGVAKASGKQAHTQLGVIKGKLLYMAPEQAMAKDIDGRADLFAMGLILYRMLTNHLPFEGDNEFQIYNNILSKEITPPRAFNPQIPEEVNQIVMMLLHRDPSKRYQDGYSAKVDLDRALQAVAPGYSISRLSRWVEDDFTHLLQKARKPQNSGANSIAPSTPSHNNVTGHGAPQPPMDQWDVIDASEDTVNVSMNSPEAQAVLQQARQARADHLAQQQQAPPPAWGQPAQQSGQFGQPPQFASQSGQFAQPPQYGQPQGFAAQSGQFPSNGQHPSGQFAPLPPVPLQSGQYPQPQQFASQSGQFPQPYPNQSGQYPQPQQFAGQSGQFPDASGQFSPTPAGGWASQSGHVQTYQPNGMPNATGGMPIQAAPQRRASLAPAIGILVLLVIIVGMLGWKLFLSPADEVPNPESPVEKADEAAVPDVEKGAVIGENEQPATNAGDVADATAEAVPDAGQPAVEQPAAEMVGLDVQTTPEGASLFLNGELLGTTPYVGTVAQSDKEIVLRVEAEGYEGKEVSAVPFSTVRRRMELQPLPGTVEEKVEEKPKEEAPKKTKPKRRKSTRKKSTPKSDAAVPLLDLGDAPVKKKPKTDVPVF